MVTVRRCAIVAVLSVPLSSCSPAPPPYESHYVPPTASVVGDVPSPTTPPQPSLASFVDDFDRADTELGLGDGWDMRAAKTNGYPLPAATDGFIRDDHFTYAGQSEVFAARQFGGTVRSIGATGRFRRIDYGGITTMSMALTSSDNLTADMVHFAANRSYWKVEIRHADGAFEPVATGRFAPKLELDRNYEFGLEATDSTVTVRVPGSEVTKDVVTAGLSGDRAFWREIPSRTPVGEYFDFDSVWASEDGQPLFPVGG